MKKILTLSLILLGLGAGITAFGAHVSPHEALNRLARSHNGHRAVASKMNAKSCKTLDHLYVFENEDGFIILPDDDRAPVLLGYCDDACFTTENNPSFKSWLEFYNAELSGLSDVPENEGNISGAQSRPERKPVAPMIATKWNQSEPYNDLCPELDDKRSVTGCVATAMAQVMKYHNWPERGTGTHSYYWENGDRELSFDFGATTFDWENMLPVYDETATEEQRKAVATLMSACGVAADMIYSPAESGANTTYAAAGMVEFLNYDQGLSEAYRAWYGLYEWEDMIYGELADNRPVLYRGRSQAGGHAFVCDGYAGDGFFHINWGWGGYCDGYFLLTALTPDGQGIGGGSPDGYNMGQSVFIGLKPRTADSERSYLLLGYEFYPYSDFLECRTGDAVWCYAGIYNYSLWTCPEGSWSGVRFTS
ncbi:MAG: C10 family peptidase, partial [Muribaculaceae bacterium]|nr:C10 family peptidase [Muribaculaceae bacterium]